MKYRIKENSVWAGIAARRLRSEKMAMVLGSTIHLHNTSIEELLQNRRWLRHELAHVKQFRQFGYLPFLWKYFREYLKNGYRQNRFEVEARAAEYDESYDSCEFIPSSRQSGRFS